MVAHVLHVVSIKTGYAFGNFAARYTASLLEHLGADFCVRNSLVFTVAHELVVEVVAASDDFNIVQVVRVDSGKAHTAVVHLTSEDFVSEEVVSEESGVTVCEVVAVSYGHID